MSIGKSLAGIVSTAFGLAIIVGSVCVAVILLALYLLSLI